MQFLPTLKRSLLAALMLTTSAFANTEAAERAGQH